MNSFLLVRHPQVMNKLRAEIANHSSAELSRNDLRNMPYLQNILKESKFVVRKLLIHG